jgi:hypothetical protein
MLMKSFRGELSVVLLSFGMLGVLGCGENNETAIRAQEAKSSDSQVTTPTKPPMDQREYFQQKPDPYKAYPGAKKQ